MSFFLFGIWEVPISFYWMFYLLLGIVGFALSYFNRYLFLLALVIIFVFGVVDFSDFYRYQVTPGTRYVVFVTFSMVLAVIASLVGAILNKRKLT